MALQPSLRSLIIAGRPDAPHTLDVFCAYHNLTSNSPTDLMIVDYVCPFSAKMAKAIDTVLKPLLGVGGEYDGKVKIIFRPQVQPWHASSTIVHEAGLAVSIHQSVIKTASDCYSAISLGCARIS
jgi:hypothetical protein